MPPFLKKGSDLFRAFLAYDSWRIEISWEPVSIEVSDNGDMAYLIENSTVSFTDSTGKTITQNNKAVSIWRKQNDSNWKNVVDISTPAGN